MDKYYFFSFIFNKLIIMHDFTNYGLLINLFTILASKDIFQIEDLIIKCANSEIRWNKKWQFCIGRFGKMEKNMENPKHGFCPKWTKLVLQRAVFSNSVRIKRNGRFFEDIFLRFAIAISFQIISVAMPNLTCSCWMIDGKIF